MVTRRARAATAAVRRLSLTDFRNYAALRLDLDDRPVALSGANGAGKTNLLEAVSFLAPGRGLVDWDKVFQRAVEIGYAGCMCIETPPFAAGANGSYSTESWKQMVDDTEALVTRALA